MLPFLTHISEDEFEKSDNIFKILTHKDAVSFCVMELNNRSYYFSWISLPPVNVDLKILETEEYLLIGVDLKVVVIGIKTGSILFSIGLFSFFKGFENTSELTFTIFSELEDLIINKNGFSISQIIPHDLEF